MTQQLRQPLSLLLRGLFLEGRAYDEAADSRNPVVEGLSLIIFVGLAIALANLIGNILGWATTPNLSQIKDIVLEGLRAMPWYDFIRNDPQAVHTFETQYNLAWRVFPTLFGAPNPGVAAIGVLLTPLRLLLGWVWFALIAHFVAKLLGGEGTLGQTVGASALAVAPNLFNLAHILPYVSVSAIATWVLLARYIAIRRVHSNLPWGRALTATLVPTILLLLLLLLGLLVLSLLAFSFRGAA